jgi:D-glycero-D-manno-heptose 1,7-bisphosphate phosphatase
MEAGRRAGLPRGWLVDGVGDKQCGFEVLPLCTSDNLERLLASVDSLGSSLS